jgi:hypothetical protein
VPFPQNGIQFGDEIAAINDQSVMGWNIDAVRQAIIAADRLRVSLTLRRSPFIHRINMMKAVEPPIEKVRNDYFPCCKSESFLGLKPMHERLCRHDIRWVFCCNVAASTPSSRARWQHFTKYLPSIMWYVSSMSRSV